MTYRAMELYPKRLAKTEMLYETQAVKYRLKQIAPVLMRGLGHVWTLDLYLTEALNHGWDLSRDINYCYANVIYPPEEIKRRIRRLYTGRGYSHVIEVELSDEISYCAPTIYSTISYGVLRTVHVYGSLMTYIAKCEQSLGYSDALNFED